MGDGYGSTECHAGKFTQYCVRWQVPCVKNILSAFTTHSESLLRFNRVRDTVDYHGLKVRCMVEHISSACLWANGGTFNQYSPKLENAWLLTGRVEPCTTSVLTTKCARGVGTYGLPLIFCSFERFDRSFLEPVGNLLFVQEKLLRISNLLFRLKYFPKTLFFALPPHILGSVAQTAHTWKFWFW